MPGFDFGDLFGTPRPVQPETRARSKGTGEVAPQVRAREIDGVWFLRAEDVLTTLEHYGHGGSPLARKLRNLGGGE